MKVELKKEKDTIGVTRYYIYVDGRAVDAFLTYEPAKRYFDSVGVEPTSKVLETKEV